MTATTSHVDLVLWEQLLGGDETTQARALNQIRDSDAVDIYREELARVIESPSFPLAKRRTAGQILDEIGDPRIDSLHPAMVAVPAGTFLMGTRAEDEPGIIKEYRHAHVIPRFIAKERPQHEVNVEAFQIGKYPVTNREYAHFVEETGHQPPASWSGQTFPAGKGNHPVVRISHDDAVAYTKWLSEKTGTRYRLAGEAEWEKAARGTDGRLYPWGNQFDPDKCNTLEGNTFAALYKRARPLYNIVLRVGSFVVDHGLIGDKFDQALGTTPVGMYPEGASPYGALDMGGNAEEWVADKFALYPGYPFPEAKFDWSAEDWVCRGGAWNRPGDVARTARRHGNFVGTGSIGLRLARDAE